MPALAAAKHWDGIPSLWSVAILIRPWMGPPAADANHSAIAEWVCSRVCVN